MTAEAFICDYVRTPIGRYGGALAAVRPDDLAAAPIRELMRRHPGLAGKVDDVFLGCANQAGEDNRNLARMALLLAGLPDSIPGATVNRLCASARAIKAGEIELAVAGGAESMTRAPFVMAKAGSAFQRSAEVFDTTIGWRFVNPMMKKLYGVDSMPETAQNVADEYQVSRADQDAFALRSQQRAAAAQAKGTFEQEIAPLFRTEGFKAPIIQDQQLYSAECPHQPGVTAIAVRQRQIGEQSGDTLVEHRVIVAACLMSKRAGEPRLSNSGRAFNDQVVLCLDPAAEGQLLEQRAVETTRRAIVDIFDRGLLAQPGIAQPGLEPAILTVREFAVEQQPEPFGVIEFAAAWVGGQFLIGARHSGEAELA